MSLTDHERFTAAVLDFAAIVVGNPSITDEDLVAEFVDAGFSKIEAEKLCAFCPSAFTWATLKLMGLEKFPSVYRAFDFSASEVDLPLSDEHIFTAALTLALETLEHGWSTALPRKTFEAVAARSAEMNATTKLLNAGKKVSGATVAPFSVLRFTADEARAG